MHRPLTYSEIIRATESSRYFPHHNSSQTQIQTQTSPGPPTAPPTEPTDTESTAIDDPIPPGGEEKTDKQNGGREPRMHRPLTYSEIIGALESSRGENSNAMATTSSLLKEYMENHYNKSNNGKESQIQGANVNDYVSARVADFRGHPGNSQYDDLINLLICVYNAATRDEKPKIAIEIYRLITDEMKPPGRFLKLTRDGILEEITVEKALCKIRKDLRNGAVKVVNSGVLEKFTDSRNVGIVKERVAARKKQKMSKSPNMNEIMRNKIMSGGAKTSESRIVNSEKEAAASALSASASSTTVTAAAAATAAPGSKISSLSTTNTKRKAEFETDATKSNKKSNTNTTIDDARKSKTGEVSEDLLAHPNEKDRANIVEMDYTHTLALKTARVNIIADDKEKLNSSQLASVPTTFLNSGKGDCDVSSINAFPQTSNIPLNVSTAYNEHSDNACNSFSGDSNVMNVITTCEEVPKLSTSSSSSQVSYSSSPPTLCTSDDRTDSEEDRTHEITSNRFSKNVETTYCGKCLGTGILPVPSELQQFSSDTHDYDESTLQRLVTNFLPSRDQNSDAITNEDKDSQAPSTTPSFGLAQIIEAEKMWEIEPREGQTYPERINAIEEKVFRARECIASQNQNIVNITVISNIDSILTKHIEDAEVKWGIIPPENSSLDDRLLHIKEVATSFSKRLRSFYTGK